MDLFDLWDEYNAPTITPIEWSLYTKEIWQANLNMLDDGSGIPDIEEATTVSHNVPVSIDTNSPKSRYAVLDTIQELTQQLTKPSKNMSNRELLVCLDEASELYKLAQVEALLTMNARISKQKIIETALACITSDFEDLKAGVDHATSRMQKEKNPELYKKGQQKFSEAMQKAKNTLSEEVWHVFTYLVDEMRQCVKSREDIKWYKELPKPIIDEFIAESTRRLNIDSSLLTFRELGCALLHKQIPKDLQVRKELLNQKSKTSWIKHESGEGLPASYGTATGPARIIHSTEEFHKVQDGDILIARSTNPKWTILFSKISGVIIEHGTLLSHAAITAREYDIPAIVGVKGITKKLKNSQIITMDGSTGEIKAAP
ncbi:MAG: PEP-utilizing enzyme [Candidatus Nanoarchaeia archaeon]